MYHAQERRYDEKCKETFPLKVPQNDDKHEIAYLKNWGNSLMTLTLFCIDGVDKTINRKISVNQRPMDTISVQFDC